MARMSRRAFLSAPPPRRWPSRRSPALGVRRPRRHRGRPRRRRGPRWPAPTTRSPGRSRPTPSASPTGWPRSRARPCRSTTGASTSTRRSCRTSRRSTRSTTSRCRSPPTATWTRRWPSCAPARSPSTCCSPPTTTSASWSRASCAPLNHSYITNIEQVWPAFQNPWYDQGWNTVPYTIYSTGIAWRVDKVTDDIAKLPNPYEALWDERYRGKVGILDDYREAIGMTLLKNGITDLNTGNQDHLNLARDQLVDLAQTVGRGSRQRLHRPARGQDLDHPGLVGRHGQRVLHAQGARRRGDAAAGSRRTARARSAAT